MKFEDTVAALPLPEGKSEHFHPDPDLPGFGVRVRRQPDGKVKRTWSTGVHRVNGSQRRRDFGDVRKIERKDAHKAARQYFAQIELGMDPAAERAKARAQAAVTKLTLAVAIERYLDAKQQTLRPSTFAAAKKYFTRHWKPLHDRPLDGGIKRADVAARLQELIKAHGRTSARAARTNLSALFAWAMNEGLCEANPVINTNDPTKGLPARDRVLSDDEIRAIWNACAEDDAGRIVRLLLLTGCRRQEIGGLKWTEVNMATGTMTIPGARTKNDQTLELTLPAMALEILQSAPLRADRDYVFASRGGPFSGWSQAKLRLDAKIAIATGKSIAPWRLHDLRRTMRSGLGKIGVAPHIAELAIGHARKGVEAIYDRHKYQRELKAALALWADYLAAVIENRESNIVTLQRA